MELSNLNEEPLSGTPLLEKLAVPSWSTPRAATRAWARVTITCERVLEAERYPEITFDPQHFTLKLRSGGQFQATMQGVLTLHGGRHDIDLMAQGQLVGDNLTATAHFSVPYVDWGMKDPSILFLTVAKQVDIDIATSGHVVWNGEAAQINEK